MENNISSIDTGQEEKKRPAFLSVLCILSFVGIAYEVISNIFGLIFTSTGFLENIELMINNMPEEEPVQILEKLGYFDMIHTMTTHGVAISLIGLFGAIICLFGVLQMWKLKKNGYYVYFIGEIGAPIMIASIWGASSPILLMMTILIFIFPIAFISMYAFNLKHMQ